MNVLLKVQRLIVPFLLTACFGAYGETLQYAIIRDHKNIGTLHIDRSRKNDITEYFFESTVKVTVLFDIEVYDRMRVTFKGNQMLQAMLYRTLNGRVKVDNTVTWNGKYYYMTNKDNENSSFKQLISFTTATLYYQEPVHTTQVFSEKFQKMIPIRAVSGSRYRMDLPNGNKTFYSYSNGVCSLVEAETDWANLKFVLQSRI